MELLILRYLLMIQVGRIQKLSLLEVKAEQRYRSGSHEHLGGQWCHGKEWQCPLGGELEKWKVPVTTLITKWRGRLEKINLNTEEQPWGRWRNFTGDVYDLSHSSEGTWICPGSSIPLLNSWHMCKQLTQGFLSR